MIIECELFLSIPKNKPPFIGVVYNHDAAIYAEVTGAEMLLIREPFIELHLEVKEGLLSITLYMRGTQNQRWYTCSFDPAALNEWLFAVRDARAINFGHVIRDRQGHHKIAKAVRTNRSFYLPVRRLLVIDSRADQVVSITARYPLLKKVS